MTQHPRNDQTNTSESRVESFGCLGRCHNPSPGRTFLIQKRHDVMMMTMMMILVLFFLEFFFYFFSRRDLNPDRRFPVAAVTANSNVSTLKPTNESSYFSRSSRRPRRRRSLRQLSTTTTRFDPATLDDDSRSGNPGHYGKLSTRILLLGHIHYAYLDRSRMLTRSTGVANTCRNLMVTLRPVD